MLFLSCKANARVKPAKTRHGPHTSKLLCCSVCCFVLCRSVYCVCVCTYVLYYCHRVTTQLQLTNISYHISYIVSCRISYISHHIIYHIISHHITSYIVYHIVSYISHHIIYHITYILQHVVSLIPSATILSTLSWNGVHGIDLKGSSYKKPCSTYTVFCIVG